jgi:hypothetical protein
MPLHLLAHYFGVLGKHFALLAFSWLGRWGLGLGRCDLGCLFEFGRCLGADVLYFLNVDVPFLGDLILGNL